MTLKKSKSVLFCCLAFLATASSLQSQQAPSKPKPGIIEVTTTLVEVDAVVTDSRGRAVTNLNVEDFQILQDGKPQPITAFSRISAGGPRLPSNPGTVRPLAREDVDRTIAFVVSDMFRDYEIGTTSTLRQVRRALNDFFDGSMRENDLIALLSLAQRQGFEQFTNNREILKSLADGLKIIPLMNLPPSSSSEDDDNRDLRALERDAGDLGTDGKLEALDRADEAERLQDLTLSGLESVVAGMQGMPGRKSIVFFSAGISNPHTLSALIDRANRTGITFYAIDPREDRREGGLSPSYESSPGYRSLGALARGTGGQVWGIHDDRVEKRIEAAIEDQNSFYILGYNPGGGSFDRRDHKIEVKVNRKDLRVRSSRTEFAGRPDTTAPEPSKPGDVLSKLLVSPYLKTSVRATLSTLFTAENEKVVLNSLVFIDGRDLKAEQKTEGTYEGGADIMAVIVNPKGEFSGHVARSFRFKFDKQGWERAQQTGFVYRLPHDAEKPGPYQVRLAVRDAVSGATAAASTFLTVPDITKGGLTASSLVLSAPVSDASPHPLSSPAARGFAKGREIEWGVEIYNAKTENTKDGGRPQLQSAIRIYRDGEKAREIPFTPWVARTIEGREGVAIRGLLSTGSLEPGEYTLQVLVRDQNAKGAQVSSFTDFRILP